MELQLNGEPTTTRQHYLSVGTQRLVNAHCGKLARPFVIVFELDTLGQWCAQATFVPNVPTNVGTVVTRCAEAVQMTGPVTLSATYPGCPHCGSSSFMHCGVCQKLTCLGEQRTRHGAEEFKCFHCQVWSECGSGISGLTGHVPEPSERAIEGPSCAVTGVSIDERKLLPAASDDKPRLETSKFLLLPPGEM